eukprot:scaffold377267_cov39-Attheya_sp.AAC.1
MSIPYVTDSNKTICAATQKSTVCTEWYPHHDHLSPPCRCGRHYLIHPSVEVFTMMRVPLCPGRHDAF